MITFELIVQSCVDEQCNTSLGILTVILSLILATVFLHYLWCLRSFIIHGVSGWAKWYYLNKLLLYTFCTFFFVKFKHIVLDATSHKRFISSDTLFPHCDPFQRPPRSLVCFYECENRHHFTESLLNYLNREYTPLKPTLSSTRVHLKTLWLSNYPLNSESTLENPHAFHLSLLNYPWIIKTIFRIEKSWKHP